MSSSSGTGAGGMSSPPPCSRAPRGASPPRPPRNWTRWATISVVERLFPSLSSSCRVRIEPSTYTCRPFCRYWPHVSPCFPHTTTLCHSVRSWRCPSRSFQTSLVATGNRATACPPPVKRTSGSFPRFPISSTLFTDIAAPSGSDDSGRVGGGQWDGAGLGGRRMPGAALAARHCGRTPSAGSRRETCHQLTDHLLERRSAPRRQLRSPAGGCAAGLPADALEQPARTRERAPGLASEEFLRALGHRGCPLDPVREGRRDRGSLAGRS